MDSLQPLATNAIHDTMEWPMAGQPTIFNGYRLATGHFVWGLTYRMLKTFSPPSIPTGRALPSYRAALVPQPRCTGKAPHD